MLSRAADAEADLDRDDSLAWLFLCCHPALSKPSQLALALRAVCGLTTAQIAAALLVPETGMAQRISRVKQPSGTPPPRCACRRPPTGPDDWKPQFRGQKLPGYVVVVDDRMP
ncbi:sigma factor-like helix-turn-helix DNA-binding protein [Streptomyces sp. ADI93-02]|uniref:sigma factor-like helix-turn-helix DNA-binding protein n=1 Tax=Streptomyces sp. ADI93-02 TaxID=1522757 RepID=UPI003216C0D8